MENLYETTHYDFDEIDEMENQSDSTHELENQYELIQDELDYMTKYCCIDKKIYFYMNMKFLMIYYLNQSITRKYKKI